MSFEVRRKGCFFSVMSSPSLCCRAEWYKRVCTVLCPAVEMSRDREALLWAQAGCWGPWQRCSSLPCWWGCLWQWVPVLPKGVWLTVGRMQDFQPGRWEWESADENFANWKFVLEMECSTQCQIHTRWKIKLKEKKKKILILEFSKLAKLFAFQHSLALVGFAIQIPGGCCLFP